MATETRNTTANGHVIAVAGIVAAPNFIDIGLGHTELFIKNDSAVAVEITFSPTTPSTTIWDSIPAGGSASLDHSVASGFWARALSGTGSLKVFVTDLRIKGGVE